MRRKPFGRGRLLTICAVALLCLSQAALAQSGRRQKTVSSPSPPDTASATTTAAGATATAGIAIRSDGLSPRGRSRSHPARRAHAPYHPV